MLTYEEINEKYLGYKQSYIPKYRTAYYVNNMLSCLMNKYRQQCKLTKIINDVGKFENKPYNDAKNIYRYKNVVPIDLAKKCRQFLNDIPHKNLPLMNDVINPPNNNVYKDICDHYLTTNAVMNQTYEPTMWTWEKYHHRFFRCSPLTLESFVGSPIIELIDYLYLKFKNTDFIDFKNLRQDVWVIQHVPKGEFIGHHMDDDDRRKIAFIYYLTPDDIDIFDGGNLVCYDCETKKHIASFLPKFNSLIMWDMTKNYGPIHLVDEVFIENRYALVGFFD